MIEVLDNYSAGFSTLISNEKWKVAFITASEQYGKLKVLKRHNLTDEAFLLVKGNALLYTLEDGKLVTRQMQKEKLYNIKKATWHHLEVQEDTLIMVVENSDTSAQNTDSMEYKR